MHIHITFMTYHLYMLIACKSLSVHVLCLWHSFYLYFFCISVSILCIFHIHSITYCSMSLTYLLSILSYHLILSCTFIYILILFIYGTFVCFNLIIFVLYFHMSFTCFSLFHLSVLCLITFYVLLHISFLILYLYHVVATRPCYTFHSSFSYLYYHIFSYYMLLSCTFLVLV